MPAPSAWVGAAGLDGLDSYLLLDAVAGFDLMIRSVEAGECLVDAQACLEILEVLTHGGLVAGGSAHRRAGGGADGVRLSALFL